ncbi:hypothetical protein [Serratia rhizosphaerae]|uniref:phage tail fiber protein n=1 Tax=Serratia rhizosphaerae TaxID=2597702 RepID=UPI001915B3BB|nr:hypothetical protein [Serratia rhizosphaerae]
MSVGTITLTNNWLTVTGSGTTFTKDLKPGDFIVSVVGGVTYTLAVETVDSDTKVMLLKAYDGPTQAGAAWSAVPRDAMNAITAQLAAEAAKALRGLNYDKQNWQQFFTADGDVTITLPDNSQSTGPSAKKIINSVDSKADKKSVDDLAAKVNTKADDDNVIHPGDFGLGHDNDSGRIQTDYTTIGQFRAFAVKYGLAAMRNNTDMGGSSSWGLNTYSPIVWVKTNDTYGLLNIPINTTDPVIVAGGSGNGINTFRTMLDNSNTTVDANGFVKKASPIARVSNNPEDMDPDFLEGFELSGCAAVNGEAKGVLAARVSTGVYRVTGSKGLAQEGWSIEVPQDVNGNRLCFVAVSSEDDGAIIVTVSKRRFDIDSAMVVAGEPMDIPSGRWIDLRLQMPDSKDK